VEGARGCEGDRVKGLNLFLMNGIMGIKGFMEVQEENRVVQ